MGHMLASPAHEKARLPQLNNGVRPDRIPAAARR